MAMRQEQANIEAIRDYTLESTMIWEESEFQNFAKMHLQKHTAGVLFWAGRYLQENLKADETSSLFKKLVSRDGTEIQTGFTTFDTQAPENMPLVVTMIFEMRFKETVSRFFIDLI